MLEIVGLDHLYLAVRDMSVSIAFYDPLMKALGFKKGAEAIGGDPHVHYFNRAIQLSIRPARSDEPHDPYRSGLHHICLRLPDEASVDEAYVVLQRLGIEATVPAYYEYATDYYAVFFSDPDEIRFELVAARKRRREIIEKWDRLVDFEDPFRRLAEREAE